MTYPFFYIPKLCLYLCKNGFFNLAPIYIYIIMCSYRGRENGVSRSLSYTYIYNKV